MARTDAKKRGAAAKATGASSKSSEDLKHHVADTTPLLGKDEDKIRWWTRFNECLTVLSIGVSTKSSTGLYG